MLRYPLRALNMLEPSLGALEAPVRKSQNFDGYTEGNESFTESLIGA